MTGITDAAKVDPDTADPAESAVISFESNTLYRMR